MADRERRQMGIGHQLVPGHRAQHFSNERIVALSRFPAVLRITSQEGSNA